MNRITREQMLIEIAYAASRRGTCGRLQVGSVIARDFHPISTGYVGAASGEPHCSPEVCDMNHPCKRTIHAEANAIFYAREALRLKVYDQLDGCVLACTDASCIDCAMLISACGIKKVFYHRPYRRTDGIDYLTEWGIEVIQVERALPVDESRLSHSTEILGLDRAEMTTGRYRDGTPIPDFRKK